MADTMGADESDREFELRSKQICRFCMSTEEPLTDLYSNENRLKSRVPLPLQIMACVSIEVSVGPLVCIFRHSAPNVPWLPLVF